MQVTAKYEIGERVFESWLIQDRVEEKQVYTQYTLRAEEDDSEASLWVIDFPASSDDIFVLCENGMTQEQAIEFFKQAADDFVGSIKLNADATDCASLLSVDAIETVTDEDDMITTVLLRTKKVIPLSLLLGDNNMTPDGVVRLGIHLCEAVSYIKKNALPRRLLTTDNIFIDADGTYILGCFGNEADTRFQSPEEHRGDATIYNAEVHSIGVILYTLLNDNRIPLLPPNMYEFTDEDISHAVQNRHAGVPLPPPRRSNVALSGIILKACAYKPKARYFGVDELRNALVCLRSGNVVVVSQASIEAAERNKGIDKKTIQKIVAAVLTVVAVLFVSNVLIDFLYPNAPQELTETVITTEQPTAPSVSVFVPNSSDATQPVVTDPTVADTSDSAAENTSSSAADGYDDAFFAQISYYHTGQYHLIGTIEQDGGIEQTELAVTKEKSLYMTSDIDGNVIGILRDKNGVIYLVNPVGKAYLELSPTVLRLIGMDTDDIEKAANASGGDTFRRPDEVGKVVYREQELVRCEYTYDSGKKEIFYLDDSGNIKYIEAVTADNVLENTIVIEKFTDVIPPEYIEPADGYEVYTGIRGLINFVTGLPTIG